MKWMLRLGLLLLCASAAGCGPLAEMTMSVPQKINAAFPISVEAQFAHERLVRTIASDAQATTSLKSLADARLVLRALSCAKNVSIGRFDSVASVKGLPIDQRCLQDQDRELQLFYELRSVAALLTMAPLRPIKTTGKPAPLPRGHLNSVTNASFARDAGVAVVRDGSGEAAVVELPSGSVIAKLPRDQVNEHQNQVSPNGQLYAVSSGMSGTVLYETRSGSRLASIPDAQRIAAWLPEVEGFIYASRSGQMMLVDAQTSAVTPHPLGTRHGNHGVHVPGSPARTLLGSSQELNLVEHERTAEGIRATLVKALRLPGNGITSGPPIVMRAGKLAVYASGANIGWLDLTSGESGVWRTGSMFRPTLAKLDETHLLLDSVDFDGLRTKTWSFDIDALTLALVDPGATTGMLIAVGERAGFMRRGNEAWFGDQVSVGEVSALDKVVADYELAKQIARLETADRLAQQQAQQGLPNSGASAPHYGDDKRMQASPSAAQIPGLAGVPADAQVHVIGIYEGQRTPGASYAVRAPRDVRIDVRPTGRPIVLALASYEPVTWIVANSNGRIAAVLLSGYNPSTVTGVGSTPVLRIGATHAYASSGPEYQRLRDAITRYTGALEIRSFQGAYTGSVFSIGGSGAASQAPASTAATAAEYDRGSGSALVATCSRIDETGNGDGVRRCLAESKRNDARRVAAQRLEALSRGVRDSARASSRQNGVIAIDNKDRSPAWCEGLLNDLISMRQLVVVDDDEATRPRWHGSEPPPSLLDPMFRVRESQVGTVVHGYVTLRWRAQETVTVRAVAPCALDSGSICTDQPYTALSVMDASTPQACHVSFVDRSRWGAFRQTMTPLNLVATGAVAR